MLSLFAIGINSEYVTVTLTGAEVVATCPLVACASSIVYSIEDGSDVKLTLGAKLNSPVAVAYVQVPSPGTVTINPVTSILVPKGEFVMSKAKLAGSTISPVVSFVTTFKVTVVPTSLFKLSSDVATGT